MTATEGTKFTMAIRHSLPRRKKTLLQLFFYGYQNKFPS